MDKLTRLLYNIRVWLYFNNIGFGLLLMMVFGFTCILVVGNPWFSLGMIMLMYLTMKDITRDS